jgi:hypothetical protein
VSMRLRGGIGSLVKRASLRRLCKRARPLSRRSIPFVLLAALAACVGEFGATGPTTPDECFAGRWEGAFGSPDPTARLTLLMDHRAGLIFGTGARIPPADRTSWQVFELRGRITRVGTTGFVHTTMHFPPVGPDSPLEATSSGHASIEVVTDSGSSDGDCTARSLMRLLLDFSSLEGTPTAERHELMRVGP